MKHSILGTGEQLGKVQDGLGIHVTTFHHPSPHSTCMVHQVHDSYYMASKHIAVNLHESNITDCAIAPPVTILVPRRAPIYYDGSISSVACKMLEWQIPWLQDEQCRDSIPSDPDHKVWEKVLHIHIHAQWLLLLYENLKLTACCIQVELVGKYCLFLCLVHRYHWVAGYSANNGTYYHE